jgi:hypothetical protein
VHHAEERILKGKWFFWEKPFFFEKRRRDGTLAHFVFVDRLNLLKRLDESC